MRRTLWTKCVPILGIIPTRAKKRLSRFPLYATINSGLLWRGSTARTATATLFAPAPPQKPTKQQPLDDYHPLKTENRTESLSVFSIYTSYDYSLQIELQKKIGLQLIDCLFFYLVKFLQLKLR